MVSSYSRKIERAKKHICDLNSILDETPPFTYVFEVDYQSGKRSIGAEKHISVLDQVALIVGDAIHNLRSALDHITWELISPYCETEAQMRGIQFPIAQSFKTLDSTFVTRQIARASENIIRGFKNLKPYRGGNDDLVLISDLDVIDKHKLLIPSANYAKLDTNYLRSLVPEFPRILAGSMTMIGHNRDVEWSGATMTGNNIRMHPAKVKKELPIPVEIVLKLSSPEGNTTPLMPKLLSLVACVEEAITDLSGIN